MKLSNRIGLLAMLGVVVGAVLAGITYPGNPYLAAVFVIITAVSLVVFVIYLYSFVFYSPEIDLPEEDADENKE